MSSIKVWKAPSHCPPRQLLTRSSSLRLLWNILNHLSFSKRLLLKKLFNRGSFQTGRDKIIPLSLPLKWKCDHMQSTKGLTTISISFSDDRRIIKGVNYNVISQVRITLSIMFWERKNHYHLKVAPNFCQWKFQALPCWPPWTRPSGEDIILSSWTWIPPLKRAEVNLQSYGESRGLPCPKQQSTILLILFDAIFIFRNILSLNF